MKKIVICCLILGLMGSPSRSQAQRKVYPHFQIFLVSSEMGGSTPFIAFWDDAHELAAGPFPIRLLELTGLLVSLDLSYLEPNSELPHTARLKITRPEASSSQAQEGPALLDKMAGRIVDRGVSKMFPDWPFLIVGHNEPSEGVLRVGELMRKIQSRILACDQKYVEVIEATQNLIKGAASYDHVLRVVELAFPPCPL